MDSRLAANGILHLVVVAALRLLESGVDRPIDRHVQYDGGSRWKQRESRHRAIRLNWQWARVVRGKEEGRMRERAIHI